MALVLAIVLFLTVALVVFSFGAAFYAPSSLLGTRLRALGWQRAQPQEKPAFKDRLEQALDPLSKALPLSPREVSRARAWLIQAGYRDARHLTLYVGSRVLLRVGEDLHHAHPDLSDEFHLVNLEMRAGKPRAEALRNLAERTGVDDIRALMATLIQTDRFGTSVAQALRVHSDSLRTERRQRAEEQAAKTTTKMVIPLVLFALLPLLFVTLGPALIQLIRTLMPEAGAVKIFSR